MRGARRRGGRGGGCSVARPASPRTRASRSACRCSRTSPRARPPSVVEVAEQMPELADEADLARRALVALLDLERLRALRALGRGRAGVGVARGRPGPRRAASLPDSAQDRSRHRRAGARSCVLDGRHRLSDQDRRRRARRPRHVAAAQRHRVPDERHRRHGRRPDGRPELRGCGRRPVPADAASARARLRGGADALRKSHRRALEREADIAIYTHELFSTGHDDDNRAAVKAVRPTTSTSSASRSARRTARPTRSCAA